MENITINPDNPIVTQSESLKLIRNSKGFTWEIRLLEINLDRLAEINARMNEQYGSAE